MRVDDHRPQPVLRSPRHIGIRHTPSRLVAGIKRIGFAFSKSVKAALHTFRQALAETEVEFPSPASPGPALVSIAVDSASQIAVAIEDSPEEQQMDGLDQVASDALSHGEKARLPSVSLFETENFWAFLDSFLKVQNSPHTRRAYENDLVDFLTFLKVSGHPMNVHTLVGYRETLQNRVSSRTGQPLSRVSINRKIATIKSFLNWLVLNGVIPNNPARAVKSFRAGRESPTRDVPNDRVRQMLALPARHKVGGRMHHAILMVLFHLGLRRAELVDLRTSDLFEQDGMRVIRVRGKGDKERVLPLTQELAKSIDTYLEMARKDLAIDQPLFSPVKNNITKIMDKPLHPNAVAYIVKHYAKLAGISYKVSPHSARATAVSNALDNLAPHRAVQHMAGWSSPLMVTRYDKRKEDLRNSAVKYVQYSDEA